MPSATEVMTLSTASIWKGLTMKALSVRKKTWTAERMAIDVRHDLAELAAVGEDDDGAVGGEQPAPEEQRTFLAAPPGGELVDSRHVAVAVAGDVGEAEVAGEEGVDQDAGGQGDEKPYGVDRASGAEDEEGADFSLPTTEAKMA